MKIVTIGQNPYLVTSGGTIHSRLIKHLYHQGNEIAVLSHSYDTNYFVPEENGNGKAMYCYKFAENDVEIKIPLFPYNKGKNPPYETEAVLVYELLEKLKPDLVITADDCDSSYFMQAVKMFLPGKFKWLWIVLNGFQEIGEQSRPLVEYADAILCTNRFTCNALENFYKHPCIDWEYVGTDLSRHFHKDSSKKPFGLMFVGKNCLKDYVPATLRACCSVSKELRNIALYLHINELDDGFYDLEALKRKHAPKTGFISFPEYPFSIKDAYQEEKMNDLFNQNPIFISSSLHSSCSMALFDALAAGCIPLVSSQGSDCEIIKSVQDFEEERNYFIYDTLDFVFHGEKEYKIPVEEKLGEAIRKLHELLRDEQKYKRVLDKILSISKRYDCLKFMKKIDDAISELKTNMATVFSL